MGGVADIDYHGNGHQVAQSSTQQGDCEPVLMDEDRQVPEDQDESENGEDDDEKDEEWCGRGGKQCAMLSITAYPEGPSCLPSQTVGEETTSDSSNSEESSLDTERSKSREQCFSQPRSRAATVQKVRKNKKSKLKLAHTRLGDAILLQILWIVLC